MTHLLAHRIGRPRLAVCCSLVVALAAAVAAAQDPPDQPSTPQDQPQRLDALEAKLDILLNEVRQLRREINRQQMGTSSYRPGPHYGPGPYPRPHREDFRHGGQRPPFGGPFRGPGFATPDHRGPGGFNQGPPSFREFRPGPGPGFDGPPGRFGPPRGEGMQRGPDGPRREDMDRGPDGPSGENMQRGPDGPGAERAEPQSGE